MKSVRLYTQVYNQLIPWLLVTSKPYLTNISGVLAYNPTLKQ